MAETQGSPPVVVDSEIVRAVTDYRVFRGAEDLEGLTKPLTWFMAGNGLVPVRLTPLGVFIGKATGSTMLGLPTLLPTVQLNCPKIPWRHLTEVVAFFRMINGKFAAEAMVQFFWDPARGEYVAYVPPQFVTGAGVHHAGHFDPEGSCWHVLDIHSHNTMSAFWSGTDDADEARFEGRLFGVVGKIDHAIPEIRWRARIGGAFLDLAIEDVIDMTNAPSVRLDRTFNAAELLTVGGQSNVTDNTTFRFTFDPFEGATFPVEWNRAIVDLVELSKRVEARRKGLITKVRFGTHEVTDEERVELKEMGLEEVSPGHWEVVNKTGGNGSVSSRPSQPHQPSTTLVGPTPKTTTTSPSSGQSGQHSGAGSSSGGHRWGYPGLGRRAAYVHNRISGATYFEAADGSLYPTYQKLADLMQDPGNTVVTMVDHVDLSKVKTSFD